MASVFGAAEGSPRGAARSRPAAARRTFLLLMGPPGAGKGTQADRLAAALGLCKISTGELLREAVRAGTELGRVADRRMREGAYVEDDVVLELVRQELGTRRCAGGAVLDGFPRTLAQAQGLDLLLAESGGRVERVVFIEIAEDEVVRRLSSRRVCEGCGRLSESADGGAGAGGEAICGTCGGRLVQRADDRPETVRRRLEVFREQTAPLLEWYRQKGLLAEVDGEGEVGRVHELVLEEVA